MPSKAAFATLLTNPAYLPGVLVVDHSLKAVGSRYPLVVLVTSCLPQAARDVLAKRRIPMKEVEHLLPEEGKHRLSEQDIRFADTWTKLRVFELKEYDRVVLLDADMVVMRNMDELMDLDLPADWIAAAHICACNPRRLPHYPQDWTRENCAHTSISHPGGLRYPPQIAGGAPRAYSLLNSGTVVLNPSAKLFTGIKNFLLSSPDVPTFSFPDQDLLAAYFRGRWKPLPYCYNALKTLRIAHPNLWRDEEVRCLHYILGDKPWMCPPGTGGEHETVNQWWWDRFKRLRQDMEASDPEGSQFLDANVARL